MQAGNGLWERAYNADVAVEIDAARLLDRVVERLGALARRVA